MQVKKTFFSGVLLLSLSTVLVKIVGLLYKIPMLSYLGSVGMGYFNSAYEIYALFCVIATAGLPVALSVLVSAALAKGEKRQAKRIFYTALGVFVLIGLIGTLAMLLFAKRFCDLMQSPNAYFCILSISPTVFLVCVASALRGYFQGYQKMLPTAISQLIEAVGKLVFGVLFARYALDQGLEPPQVAAAAGVGLTVGTALSLLYLLLEAIRFRILQAREKEEPMARSESEGRIMGRLARLAVPMTLGASVVSLTKLVDMTMILRRLQAIGYTEALANDLYGSYTTLALSVFGLIPSLVTAVALPLVPSLSAAIAANDRDRQVQLIKTSYRLVSFFAIPSALGVAAFSKPILSLLFARESEAVATAAPLLSLLGASVFLSCMITATNSVLHAYRRVAYPVLAMLAGTLIKILSSYILIGIPAIGMMGAPISTFLCDGLIVGMNLIFCVRVSKTDGVLSVFIRPLGAALLSVGGAYALYLLLVLRLGEGGIVTVGCLSLAVLLYLFFSCLFGILEAEELCAMPMGDKLCRILRRMKLLRENGEKKEGLYEQGRNC